MDLTFGTPLSQSGRLLKLIAPRVPISSRPCAPRAPHLSEL